MPDTPAAITAIADRPELAPMVARWLWDAFWRGDGYALAEVEGWISGAVSRLGPPQCFVLLLDGAPAGTASLAADDLDSRPDLTPWLAGVWVEPWARRQGHAMTLVRTVEAAAQAAGVPVLWLYTREAERLYLRAGWRTVERFEHHGAQAALMRRDLAPAAPG